MAELVPRDRVIKVKLVYYGPALCGKTTNLEVLHQMAAPESRGNLISLNSLQDRTILFDLLPLRVVGPRGYQVAIQIAGVPGQSFYSATRRSALKSVDGIVFVANSAEDRLDENVASLRELDAYLVDQGIDPNGIPMVLQYNKRDLPKVLSVEALDRALNSRGARAVSAVATGGEGVLETFETALECMMSELSSRYRVLEMAAGQTAAGWAHAATSAIFSSGTRQVEAAESSTLKVRVPALSASGPRSDFASAPPITVEAYAEACSEMATMLSDANEKRDEAERHVAELRRSAEVAIQVSYLGAPGSLQRILSCIAEAGDATHASLVLFPMSENAMAVPLPPLPADPLMANPSGIAFVRRAAGLPAPLLLDLHETPQVVGYTEPPFHAALAVPIGVPGRPTALALLYYVEGDRYPDTQRVEHLRFLAGLFATPLRMALAGAKGETMTTVALNEVPFLPSTDSTLVGLAM
jgi:signal recognition particle receptor subunit beta